MSRITEYEWVSQSICSMQQISQMHVLVVGLRGCGVEIAKNLAMSGIQRLTLVDEELVREEDIGLGFVYRKGDEGKPKATTAAFRLAELAPFADVRTLCGDLSLDLLLNFHVVVLASASISQDEVIAFNEFCRVQHPPIGLVVVESRGLFGYVFSDFSSTHHSWTTTSSLADIGFGVEVDKSNVHIDDKPVSVTVNGLSTFICGYIEVGDQVSLHAIDRTEDRPLLLVVEDIQSDSSLRLKVLNGRNLEDVVSQLNRPVLRLTRLDRQIFKTSHRSLRECLVDPGPLLCPLSVEKLDSGRGFSLHTAMLGVHEFQRKFGVTPRSNKEDHEAEICQMVESVVANMKMNQNVQITQHEPNKIEDINKELVKSAIRCSSSEWLPLSALIAGYASLQAVKFSGALGQPLYPQNQFLYFDLLDSTSEEGVFSSKGLPIKDASLAAILGVDQVKVLQEANLLVVGMSCANSEVLKNLSCIGVGSRASVRVMLNSDEKPNVGADDLVSRVIFSPLSVGKKVSDEIRNFYNNVSVFGSADIDESPWKLWANCKMLIADSTSIWDLVKFEDWCRAMEIPAILTHEDQRGFRRIDTVIPHVTGTLLERQLTSEDKSRMDKYFMFDYLSPITRGKTIASPVLSIAEQLMKNSLSCFELIFQFSTRVARGYFQDDWPENRNLLISEEVMVWMSWTVVQRGLVENYKDCLRVGWLMLELLPMWMKQESTSVRDMENGRHCDFVAFAKLDVEDPDTVQLLVATACIIGESARVPIPPVEARRELLSDVSAQREAFSLHTNPRTWRRIKETLAGAAPDRMKCAVARVREISIDLDDNIKGHAHFLQSITNLQLSWNSRGATKRVETLPELRLLCRCKHEFLPIVAILGAICTMEMTKLLVDRKPRSPSGTYDYVARMTPTRKSPLVSIVEAPLPLVVTSIPLDASRGRPVRTVPETLTRWSKIAIPVSEGLQQLDVIIEYIETKYSLSVQSVYHQQQLVAMFGGRTAATQESCKQSVFEICCSTEVPRPPFVLLELVAVDSHGDVVLAPVKVVRGGC